MELQKFMQLSKIDVANKLLYGIFTAEQVDKSGEIADYPTTKIEFQKWSDDMKKVSKGKSLGNVRKMHGKEVCGKVTKLEFDDVNKIIHGAVEVNQDTLEEAEKGFLNGFSIGGSYLKKWDDKTNKAVRFTPAIAELSVVDNPCVPDAIFSAIKDAEFAVIRADGSEEMRKFAPKEVPAVQAVFKAKDGSIHESEDAAKSHNAELEAKAPLEKIEAALKAIEDALKGASVEKREFTQAEREKAASEGDALPDGSFPIHNKEDLHNAIQAYGRAKDKSKARAHIKAKAKELGAADMLPDTWGKYKTAEDLIKGMHHVAHLAGIISDLHNLHQASKAEEENEGDAKSIVPGGLGDAKDHLTNILHQMVQEETEEMKDCPPDYMKAAFADLDEKEFNALNAIKFEHAQGQSLEKNAPSEDLTKITAERDALQKALDSIPAMIEQQVSPLIKRIKELEDQPIQQPQLFLVEKDSDEPTPVSVSRGMSPAQQRDFLNNRRK